MFVPLVQSFFYFLSLRVGRAHFLVENVLPKKYLVSFGASHGEHSNFNNASGNALKGVNLFSPMDSICVGCTAKNISAAYVRGL